MHSIFCSMPPFASSRVGWLGRGAKWKAGGAPFWRQCARRLCPEAPPWKPEGRCAGGRDVRCRGSVRSEPGQIGKIMESNRSAALACLPPAGKVLQGISSRITRCSPWPRYARPAGTIRRDYPHHDLRTHTQTHTRTHAGQYTHRHTSTHAHTHVAMLVV